MCLGQNDAADLRRRCAHRRPTNFCMKRSMPPSPQAKGHDFVIDRVHAKPAVARHMSVTGG